MHNQMYPYSTVPYGYVPQHNSSNYRQQVPIQGQATWTYGGQVTQCGIPWSENQYMTVAVGYNTPYRCGQLLKVTHMTAQGPKEVIVTIVDRVRGYPPNRINLHRRAFEALGARPEQGVINVSITPSPELEEEKWGKYLLEVTQVAYPNDKVVEYEQVSKQQLSGNQVREIYKFVIQSPQDGERTIQGTVIYDSQTDRVISFDIKEM